MWLKMNIALLILRNKQSTVLRIKDFLALEQFQREGQR
jgi:hypothetical protein